MSKHTPGPWGIRYTSRQDGKGGYCSVSIYKAAKSIVAKRVQGRLTLEDEANAHLIAAAPDLLKVAEIASALRDEDWEEGNTQQLHDRIDYLVGVADDAIEEAKPE